MYRQSPLPSLDWELTERQSRSCGLKSVRSRLGSQSWTLEPQSRPQPLNTSDPDTFSSSLNRPLVRRVVLLPRFLLGEETSGEGLFLGHSSSFSFRYDKPESTKGAIYGRTGSLQVSPSLSRTFLHVCPLCLLFLSSVRFPSIPTNPVYFTWVLCPLILLSFIFTFTFPAVRMQRFWVLITMPQTFTKDLPFFSLKEEKVEK